MIHEDVIDVCSLCGGTAVMLDGICPHCKRNIPNKGADVKTFKALESSSRVLGFFGWIALLICIISILIIWSEDLSLSMRINGTLLVIIGPGLLSLAAITLSDFANVQMGIEMNSRSTLHTLRRVATLLEQKQKESEPEH